MFTTKKIAVVSVINDLVTDNRVNKTCFALKECDYEVVLIGRRLANSLPMPAWPFINIRMRFFINKGPLFYFFFNLRLFFKLLFKKANLLYANDLDTLLPNFLVSRIRNIPLIYDSHELFCEVPELVHSKLKRNVWLAIEGWIVPKLKTCITVNESLASFFGKKYQVKFHAIRNISDSVSNFEPKSRAELNLPANKKIIILQGAGINIDRGAEELIDAMIFVENTILLIIGGGDVWPVLKNKIERQNLKDKITLIDKIPKSELLHYTYNSDLGLSIDKNTNLNYFYSLPNKIFDYINAGVPILASRLPEIENVIRTYKIGDFVNDHDPKNIASKLNEVLNSPHLAEYKRNTIRAKSELNWATEKIKLISLLKEVQK